MCLIERLTPILRDVFGDEALIVTEDTNATNVAGWDSFSHINLVVALESEFQVQFSTMEIRTMTGVRDIIAFLEKKKESHEIVPA